MRRLLMILLSASLSIQTRADPCQEIKDTADRVIAKQQEIIDLTQKRFMDVMDDNTRVNQQLAQLGEMARDAQDQKILYGVSGVLLGVIAGVLVMKGR